MVALALSLAMKKSFVLSTKVMGLVCCKPQRYLTQDIVVTKLTYYDHGVRVKAIGNRRLFGDSKPNKTAPPTRLTIDFAKQGQWKTWCRWLSANAKGVESAPPYDASCETKKSYYKRVWRTCPKVPVCLKPFWHDDGPSFGTIHIWITYYLLAIDHTFLTPTLAEYYGNRIVWP